MSNDSDEVPASDFTLSAHILYFSVFIHGYGVETIPNLNLMAQCNLLLIPNWAFPVQPIANAKLGLPSAIYLDRGEGGAANTELGLPSATSLLTPNQAFSPTAYTESFK